MLFDTLLDTACWLIKFAHSLYCMLNGSPCASDDINSSDADEIGILCTHPIRCHQVKVDTSDGLKTELKPMNKETLDQRNALL